MPRTLSVDLFAEDLAHEAYIGPLLRRLAQEEEISLDVRVRSAVGGHPRAFHELDVYQLGVTKGALGMPNILVVAIDGNCVGFNEAKDNITSRLKPPLSGCAVTAVPDPHIERWFLADLNSFHRVVGHTPTIAKQKCDRDYYKNALEKAVRAGGNPVTLRGIEFAEDLVGAMDLYRAAKAVPSLGHFIDDMRAGLRRFG